MTERWSVDERGYIRDGGRVITESFDDAHDASRSLVRAANAAERMRWAIDKALHELGVPQPGYPAPVANAVDVLATALAAYEKED